MGESEIFEVLRASLWTGVLMGLPILGVTLVLGFLIGLVQALTSVQEMTLTFVPKIVAIFIGLLAFTPLMYTVVKRLSDRAFDLIVSGGL
ncbi:MAG: flagellar biosynthetic protein FliQ [Pseudomonadota bacterium]|nr:flagellar biosynthetic protein FliQ [Pseudomonadota bacterium]